MKTEQKNMSTHKTQTKRLSIGAKLKRLMLACFALCFFVSVALIGGSLAAPAVVPSLADGNTHPEWTKYNDSETDGYGDGTTAETAWLIGNDLQLEDFANQVNGAGDYAGAANTLSGKYIKMTADIDLSAYSNWAPIGTSASIYFAGNFDGGSFMISNLYEVLPAGGYGGFFGYINNGVILNLGVSGYIRGARSQVGGIAWTLTGTDSRIENCYSMVNLVVSVSTGTSASAGGIVSLATNGSIIDCYNMGPIDSSTGGAAARCILGGIVSQATNVTIRGCYNTGSIGKSFDSQGYGGGIAGISTGGSIIGCYNTGDIVGAAGNSNSYAGGIVGTTTTAISDCHNTGAVISTSSLTVGGIAGRTTVATATISNCYNTGVVTGSNPTGGIAGTTVAAISNCYNTGAVNGPNSAGGIAGTSSQNISGCYNTGNVVSAAVTAYIGGIAGTSTAGAITNCYNTGGIRSTAITGTLVLAGGIAGVKTTGNISSCYNMGAISTNPTGNSANTNIGGIVGRDSSPVTACYNTGSVTSQIAGTGATVAGGIVGNVLVAACVVNYCYNAGAVSATVVGSPEGEVEGAIVGKLTLGTVAATNYYDITKFSGYAVGSDTALLPDAGLTTTQMTHADTLTGDMSAINTGSAFLKRTNISTEQYYPELAAFNGSADTQIEHDSKVSVTTGNPAAVPPVPDISKITYTYQGATGNCDKHSDIAKVGFVVQLVLPTRTHYDFLGWFDAAAGGVQYTDGYGTGLAAWSETGDKALYAHWEPVKYYITYNLNGGTNHASNPEYYTIESAAITLAGATRIGYGFDGWFEDEDFTVPAVPIAAGSFGAREFWAKWTANQYAVSFKTYDTGTLSDITVTFGSTYGTGLPDGTGLSKTGYHFDGWYTDENGSDGITAGTGTLVTSATTVSTASAHTLYAKWTINSYTVKYERNDGGVGTGGANMSDSTYEYGEAKDLSKNTYTKTGYNFAGWAESATGAKKYDDEEEVTDLTTTNGAVFKLYAKWTAKTGITVSFVINGGTGTTDALSVTYDGTYGTLPVVTKTGYTFGGWYKESAFTNVVTANTIVANESNHNLYAKWTAITYKVKYNRNDGGVGTGGAAMDNSTFEYDRTTDKLTQNTYTKTGYAFKGWTVAADGTGTVYADKAPTTATALNLASTQDTVVELHAKWEAITYKVKYDANGGSGTTMDYSTFTYDSRTDKLSKNTYDKTGYAFIGWAETASGAVAYNDEATATQAAFNFKNTQDAEMTLYAKWEAITYYIQYERNDGGVGTGGDAMDNSTFTYDKTDDKLRKNTYTKTGYMFLGWALTAGGNKAYDDEAPVTATALNLADMQGATVKLYAKWEAITYKVKYDANGGSGTTMDYSTFTYDDANSKLRSITYEKSGYGFTGWTVAQSGSGTPYADEAEAAFNFASTQSAEVTLYAQWSMGSYTITYELNGGTNHTDNPTSYTVETEDITLEDASRTGYTFKGWWTTSDFADGTKVTNVAIAKGSAENKKFWAKWEAISGITVSFVINGGTGTTDALSVTYDGTYGTLPTVTKTGYTFGGWYKESAFTNVVTANTIVANAQNHNLYAKWTVISGITVSFVINGGTGTTDALSVTYDGAYGTLPVVTKTGYTFGGWYKESAFTNVVTANTIVANAQNHNLYAKWEAITYKVKYDANGGSGTTMDYSTFTYDSRTDKLSKNTYDKTGYAFIGWAETASGAVAYSDEATATQAAFNFKNTQDAEMTLYAKWEAITYYIQYERNDGGVGTGGNAMGNSTFEYDKTDDQLRKNTYTKTGYAFKGWNTEADGTGTDYVDEAPTTATALNLASTRGDTVKLYAKWEAITYKVKYDANGGSGTTMDYSTFTYDSRTDKLSKNTYNRTGYDFIGWAETASGAVVYGDEATATQAAFNFKNTQDAEMTLYAKWQAITYTVKYDANGGSVVAGESAMSDSTFTYDDANSTLGRNTYEKTGYTFLGWTIASSGDGTVYTDEAQAAFNFASAQSAEVTLHAKWSVGGYTITYVLNGGINHAQNPNGYTVESEDITLRDASLTGHTFKGWFDNENCTGTAVTTIAKGSTTGDKKFWAKWEANEYTITYKDGNANLVAGDFVETPSFTHIYGTETTLKAAKNKTGYTFEGWYMSSIFAGLAVTSIGATEYTTNITLYGRWTADTYTITYRDKDGTTALVAGDFAETPSFTHTYGTTTTLKAAKNKTGYTFEGWYTNIGLTNSAGTSIGATAYTTAITLYGKWTADEYDIEYELNGGTNSSSNLTSYTIEYADITLYNPTNADGYTFDGWWTTSGFTAGTKVTGVAIAAGSTGNKKFYAKWKQNEYDITYMDGNAAYTGEFVSPHPTEHIYGNPTGIVNAKDKTGYTFRGWYKEAAFSTKVNLLGATEYTGEITLYGLWTPNDYMITYSYQQATGGNEKSGDTVTYDAGYVLVVPTRNGYDFVGWWSQTSGGTQYTYSSGQHINIWNETASRTLYARWTISTYTIDYRNVNTATNDNVTEYRIDSANIPLVPLGERRGNAFGGWYDNAGFTGNAVTAINTGSYGNKIFYARWLPSSYTVTYDAGAGDGNAMGNSTHTYGVGKALNANTYTKTGYAFIWWTKNPDGSGAHYTDGATVLDLSDINGDTVRLYAQWSVASYHITYMNISGAINTNQNSYTMYDSTITLVPAIRAGYTAGEWYASENLSGEPVKTIPTGSAGDKTFWAQWTPNEYTVAYSANGGAGSTRNSTYFYGTVGVLSPSGYTKEGYRFVGWNTQADGSGTQYANEASIVNLVDQNGVTVKLYAQWVKVSAGGIDISIVIAVTFSLLLLIVAIKMITRNRKRKNPAAAQGYGGGYGSAQGYSEYAAPQGYDAYGSAQGYNGEYGAQGYNGEYAAQQGRGNEYAAQGYNNEYAAGANMYDGSAQQGNEQYGNWQ